MKITTDSRTLRSPDSIAGFVKLLQEVLHRRPLPDPDGFVDSNAQIIPNSKGDAVALVREINNDTQATTDSLIDRLGLSDKNTHVTQKLAYSTDNGPGDDIPHGLNVTESGQERN